MDINLLFKDFRKIIRIRPKMLIAIYVFMGFSVLLIIFGLLAPNKNFPNESNARDATDRVINRLTQAKGQDNFFLGSWKGNADDLLNGGFADSAHDGYTYEFNFNFSIDTRSAKSGAMVVGRFNLYKP